MGPVRSDEIESGQAKVGSKSHYTPAPVAAHHPGRAVGVEKVHREVIAGSRSEQDHPVGADAIMPVAKASHSLRIQHEPPFTVIRHKEIIPCTLILIQNHLKINILHSH